LNFFVLFGVLPKITVEIHVSHNLGSAIEFSSGFFTVVLSNS